MHSLPTFSDNGIFDTACWRWGCTEHTHPLLLYLPYRVNIRVKEKYGIVSALSAGAYITTFYVMVDIVIRGWACTPPPTQPHPPWLVLPSWWNVPQKVAIATLCTLWCTPTSWVTLPPPPHSPAKLAKECYLYFPMLPLSPSLWS